MANPEHLEILKQGVEVWNRWREENPDLQPDLGNTEFSKANLSGVDLAASILRKTNFFRANLRAADFSGAKLSKAILSGANLSGANLCKADLSGADLSAADLFRADLSNAIMGWTSLIDIDLSTVNGLRSVKHLGPSEIGIRTLYHSRGRIPERFLQGVGVPEIFINYLPSLTSQPIQFYSCFISYSSKDEAFAKRLHADLQDNGVRCWFAPEDMKIGDKIRPAIDQSIRIHDKLLIILSQHSINSTWVEKEVETAFEEEAKRNQIVLFPVRLDGTVMETDQAWAADIRRTRHIGDFSRWKDHDAYQQTFERLLRDLKAEG